MCDAGLDGDMYDPYTPSGKPVNAPMKFENGRAYWDPVPPVLGHITPPSRNSIIQRIKKAVNVLLGKED